MGWIFLDYRNNKEFLDKNTIIDLCTLFSNLLSNAIASAQQCINENEAMIDIRFSGGKKYFSIIITNSVLPQNSFTGRKTKDRNHGHGLYKIKDVIEKYDGRHELKWEEDKIIVTVYLPV